MLARGPRRLAIALVLTTSCAGGHGAGDDASAPSDASLDASFDANAPTDTPPATDAPLPSDASPPNDGGPRARPPSWPTLHPVCGARSYDVADPSTYDSADEMALAMFEALCARSVRCVSSEIACDPQREAWQTSTSFHDPADLDGARRCLASIDTTPCDDGLFFEVCRTLDRTHAPDGTACSEHVGCASGRCVGSTPGAACAGRCAPLVTCAPACSTDAWCDPVRGVCVPRHADGAPCGFGDDVPCVEGTACVGPGICSRVSADGEPCTSPCAPGLTCAPSGLCRPPVTVAAGEPCDDYHRCAPDSDCRSSVCVARVPRGGHCDATNGCADGSACNDAHVCAPLVGPGCPCDDGSACPYMLACLPSAGSGRTCQPIGVVPTPCTTNEDCDAFECVGGFCYGRVFGEPCDDTWEHRCYAGECLDGVCTPPLPRGADCTGDPLGCMRPEFCRAGRCAGEVNVCWPDGT